MTGQLRLPGPAVDPAPGATVGDEQPLPVTALALPEQVAGHAVLALRRALHLGLRQGHDLVLDCSNVSELSPAAQGLLVATSRAARSRGTRLRLVRPTPAMVEALARSGLRHLLEHPPPAQDHLPVPQRRRSTCRSR